MAKRTDISKFPFDWPLYVEFYVSRHTVSEITDLTVVHVHILYLHNILA